MKRCNSCDEEFQGKYSFCPVDGKPLSEIVPVAGRQEFELTIVSDLGLLSRLVAELEFVLSRIRTGWPSFKRHPIVFSLNQLRQLQRWSRQIIARPHVLSGACTAVLLVSAIILGVLLLEKHSARSAGLIDNSEEHSRTVEIDLRNEEKPRTDSGVGAGGKGRVGFNRGRGEGSNLVPARARGGGSGGMGDLNVPSQGRLPQPSVVPAPISTTMARLPPQALPAAGLDIDPALWRNLEFTSYGDPRSKSITPSNGPGDGGGIGTGNGTGIGDGKGPGFGHGRDGNIGDGPRSIGGRGKGGSSGDTGDEAARVFSPLEVTQRARVLSKPEPQYTEEARKNLITGTVILRVVFSRSGEVTNIRAQQTLGGGLTEKAMAAARQIRFVPAMKDGRAVSMYMQLEYNFNLY
jgi:TonB family protein